MRYTFANRLVDIALYCCVKVTTDQHVERLYLMYGWDFESMVHSVEYLEGRLTAIGVGIRRDETKANDDWLLSHN